MRSSVNTGLERNATRSISSGLVDRLGQSSSVWSDITHFVTLICCRQVSTLQRKRALITSRSTHSF